MRCSLGAAAHIRRASITAAYVREPFLPAAAPGSAKANGQHEHSQPRAQQQGQHHRTPRQSGARQLQATAVPASALPDRQ